MSPWVRVIIVNYNAGDYLACATRALAAQTDPNFEAVVVENGSDDGSIDRLSIPDQRFSIVRAGGNIGFAAGCNLGARGASTPWLAMLNPDAAPRPNWLEAARDAIARHPRVAAFGSTQLSAENEALLDGAGDNYSIFGLAWRGGYSCAAEQVTSDFYVFSPCAAAAFYRREAFESVGGFAESFFCYREDVDLGFRLRLAGHDVMQLAKAQVTHAGSAITGRQSAFTIYHSARNNIYMLVRCMPMPLLVIALPLHLAAQAYITTRCRALLPYRAQIRGILDGLNAMPQLLRERRKIQTNRRLTTIDIARIITWTPRRLSRHEIVSLRKT